MTNIQRTINWIDRTVEEAPKDGKPFYCDYTNPIMFGLVQLNGWSEKLGEFAAEDFRYYTRDKITP